MMRGASNAKRGTPRRRSRQQQDGLLRERIERHAKYSKHTKKTSMADRVLIILLIFILFYLSCVYVVVVVAALACSSTWCYWGGAEPQCYSFLFIFYFLDIM
jgi:hypothetical protein